MRVLVTGGAGFIGSHLCNALIDRGYRVWCVDNFYLGKESNIEHLKKNHKFHFHKLNVLDRTAMDTLFSKANFDMVFHLAANSDIKRGSADHSVDLNLNFLTTIEILEAMLRYRVKKIFFACTSAIFGKAKEMLYEDYGPLRPISFYGASKLAAEAFISVFVEHYDFKAWVLRFPNVVGDRCTHGVVHDFIMQLKRNPKRLVVLGDGTQSKPYLHVRDLIKGILMVFDKSSDSLAVYHVGNEDSISVRKIAHIVVREMGLSRVAIEYTGGKIGWIGDISSFSYDSSKIKMLGFKPKYNSTQAIHMAVRQILGRSESYQI